ncbi:MAG TPA: SDR family oxidoreductase [Gaiellaceae bacterium]|jgi:NAD(P)-dependent dehydrogenase (short-subunit alcohol dehydrogenase family)
MAGTLAGKVAIVTGGGRGIGRGIARALLEEGARVTAVSRTERDLEETRNELGAGGELEVQPLDVSDRSAVDALFGTVRDRHGSLDALVCSHGVYDAEQPFLELTDDQWDQTLGINLRGTFICGQTAARIMAADETPGRIVVVTSINGLAAEPACADYNASKAGLHGLVRSMACDLAPHGITVNAVAPGWVRSPMSAPYLTEEIVAGRKRFNPVGRVGEPKDIGGAAAWLCAPATSYVTGAVLVVDGGQTAMLPMPVSVELEG